MSQHAMLDVVVLEARMALARVLRRLANRIAGYETSVYNGGPRKGRVL